MEFNSIKSSLGNVTAGTAAGAVDSAYGIGRRTAPDFTSISLASRQAKNRMAKAAMTAEARVARTGLNQVTKNKGKEKNMDAYKKAGHQYMDEYRKAGILGAFNTVAQGYGMGVMRKQNEKDKAAEQVRWDDYMSKLDALQNMPRTPPPKYEPGQGPQMPQPTAGTTAPTFQKPLTIEEFQKQYPNGFTPPTQGENPQSMSFTPPQSSNLSAGFTNLNSLTDDDWKMLSFGVSGEAERGTDDEFAVAGVILNRLASGRSGGHKATNLREVLFAPSQFSAVTGAPDGSHGPTAYHDAGLLAKLKGNPQKLQQVMQQLNGITQFRGTKLYGNMKPGDLKFSPKGNFYFPESTL